MLLGWKRKSKAHLWVVAVPLLLGWLVFNWSQWSDDESLGEGFHDVLGTQMERFEFMHAGGERLLSLADRQVEDIDLLIREAKRAGLDDAGSCVDMALACLVLGEARPHEKWAIAAPEYLERATDPLRPGESGYYPQVAAVINGTALGAQDKSDLEYMLEHWPEDWWVATLVGRLGLDESGAARGAMLARGQTGMWKGGALSVIWPLIYLFAIVAVLFVGRRLVRTEPAPRYSERMLKVVPVPVMLVSFSVMMWMLFIVSGLVTTLVVFGLSEDTAWWRWWAVVVGMLALEPFAIRRSAGLNRGSTARVLGWRWGDLRSPRNWLFALSCAWITLSLIDVLSRVLEWAGAPAGIRDSLRFVGEGSSAAEGVAMLLYGCVVVPVVEELVFRGMLYRTMRNAWGGAAAALVSSAIFSVVHVYSLIGTVGTFVYGLVFCLVYQRTGSIAIAAMAHGLINLTIAGSAWLAGW